MRWLERLPYFLNKAGHDACSKFNDANLANWWEHWEIWAGAIWFIMMEIACGSMWTWTPGTIFCWGGSIVWADGSVFDEAIMPLLMIRIWLWFLCGGIDNVVVAVEDDWNVVIANDCQW